MIAKEKNVLVASLLEHERPQARGGFLLLDGEAEALTTKARRGR
jgi:hypothetical protein